MSTQNTAPDFGEPWQSETGDFEIYSKSEHNATAYAESARIRDRIIKCVNATAGMQDPAAEIQAMRTAIREAHELLISSDDTGDLSEPLAKLKPFLP